MKMLEGFTPWPEELAKKYTEQGYWKNETLGDMLDKTIKAYPGREAVVTERARLNYAELGQMANRLALKLLELGIKKEDRVVVQLPNWHEVVYFYYAMARFGGISVMALRQFRQREMEHLLNLSGAVAWVIPDEYHGFSYVDMAREVLPLVFSLKYVMVSGKKVSKGMLSLDEILADKIEERHPQNYLARFRPDPNDVLLLLLTGGTTALPKLIPHTHNDFLCSKRQIAAYRGFDRDTVSLIVVPIAHNAPMGAVTLCGMYGAKVALLDSTRPEDIVAAVERCKVTEMFLVPTQIIDLLNFPDLKKYNVSSLKVIFTGGSRCPPEVVREAMSRMGCHIVNAFGMGEGVHITTRMGDPVEVISNTVGRPCCKVDEFKIVDEQGRGVPVGVEGELASRGPHVFRGYYKNPEENATSFDKESFFFTGDLAMWREDGNIVITGRKKDMILRGGENIAAVEIEELLLAHPDIVQAAVLGMPDPRMGERVCAYIKPRVGKSFTLEEVVAFLRGKNLALFKLPERVEILEEFPLTNIGKVSKKDLKEDITRKLKAEGKTQ